MEGSLSQNKTCEYINIYVFKTLFLCLALVLGSLRIFVPHHWFIHVYRSPHELEPFQC